MIGPRELVCRVSVIRGNPDSADRDRWVAVANIRVEPSTGQSDGDEWAAGRAASVQSPIEAVRMALSHALDDGELFVPSIAEELAP